MDTRRHTPRLRNAVALAIAGWLAVVSLADTHLQGWAARGTALLGLILWALALVEGTVLLTLEELIQLNERVTGPQYPTLDLAPVERTTSVMAQTVSAHPAAVRWTVARLPLDPQRLRVFAQSVLAGAPLSNRRWAGPNKLMSDPEFRAFMAVMERRGYAELKNPAAPRRGFRLTEPRGRTVMEVASAWVRPE